MYGLHQGYLYQDILTAFLISENLQNKDFKIGVEYKESIDDSFDDIVFIADGNKRKYQVKHSASIQPLCENDFTKSSSNLYLAKLAKSFLANEDVVYIIATNRRVKANPFFIRHHNQKSFTLPKDTYIINRTVSINKKFLRRLIIEAHIPDASFDLSKPGSMEKELLQSLRLKVGIGYYPNNQVDVRDVAGRLILLASQLRSFDKSKLIDRNYIFNYINLNFEYGHIAQIFPFISSEHRLYRKQIVTIIEGLISKHQFTILEGSPGSGKSHIFDDLFSQLAKNQIDVARHFCYLEPTDQFAQERIVADAMYGNFIYQLEKLEPKLTQSIRPHFAATKINVEKLIEHISQSGKRVVLMVDGLDHINRVVAQNKLSPDLINNFISELLEIRVPKGCSIFIASQPTTELRRIIKSKKAGVYYLTPWDEGLIKEFTIKHVDHLPTERIFEVNTEIIKLLTDKTEGNPLYLTYVLNEAISRNTKIDFTTYINNLPKLNNDLNNYYKHITNNFTDDDFAVVQTLGLLDFSVSQNELSEMFPPIQKCLIASTLNKIQPILKPGIVQGGIRIYHESFRRFIIEQRYKYKQKEGELYQHITNWLEQKGFFVSQRAYRYLIPYLIRSNKEEITYKLLERDFVARSLFYFHSVENILANLNKIADYSARKQRWDIYCEAVELRRGLHTFSEERFDSVNDVYHRAILNVHGVNMFCERLLFDGKHVFPETTGIKLCQMAEHAGGNPPWDYYNVACESISVGNTSEVLHYQEIEAAHFLNLIHNSSEIDAIKTMSKMITNNAYLNTEQQQIGMLLREFDFVFGVSNNYRSLLKVTLDKKKKIILSIEIAGYLYRSGNKKMALHLSTNILKNTKDPSLILQCILSIGNAKGVKFSGDIIKLTNQILGFQGLYNNEKPIFIEWYKTLRILSFVNPTRVRAAQKLLTKFDGWYRAWILYLFELSLLEASIISLRKKEVILEESLKKLAAYTHPFKGTPRAVDLYGINEFTTDSFKRTLTLARDFSNYKEILNLLSDISRKSTTYLRGLSEGPLNGETFIDLLEEQYPLIDNNKKRAVRKLIEVSARDGIGSSVYYDSSASEYLKLATVFALNNNSKSKECLMEGCVRLAAYGQRKDITIFEIIEPIKYIAQKNLGFAKDAFRRTYPLIETVWRYTDGKETNWALISWLRTLAESDIKIAIQTITEIVIIHPKRDWRVETGTEYLCDKLLENNIEPSIIADLYETIGQKENTHIDVSVGLNITKALLKKRMIDRAQKLFDFVCTTLYWVSITEHVSEKENFAKILSFAKENNLIIKDHHLQIFEEENTKGHNSQPSFTGPNTKPPIIPLFNFTGLSLAKIRRLIEDNSPSHLLDYKNVKKLGTALSKFNDAHLNEVRDLILSLVRRGLYSSEDIKGLILLRDIIHKNRKNELAAFVSMLGFIYARGGGGWYALADSKYNYLGRDAFRISKEVAQRTLASEMSYLFSKSSYFVGPVRHLIEFLPSNGNMIMAQKIWNEAYEVIKFRLPTHPNLDKILAKETPSFNYERRKSMDTLLIDIINARRAITN